jgi:hypothetical protein
LWGVDSFGRDERRPSRRADRAVESGERFIQQTEATRESLSFPRQRRIKRMAELLEILIESNPPRSLLRRVYG